MAGISIDFAANVTKFIGGTKDIEKALGDVSDSLDDLASDAQKAGRDAEKGLREIQAREARDNLRTLADEAREAGSDMETYFTAAADELDAQIKAAAKDAETHLESVGDAAKDSATEAETAAERLEASFRDAFDKVKTDAKKAGDDVGKGVSDGAERAGDGIREGITDEAADSAREVAASFRGDPMDALDALQETAANALASFGPAGIAAGVVAAAGVGIVGAQLEKAKERAQETAEQISEVADQLIDLGSASIGPEQVDEALRDAATSAEDGKNQLEEWAKWAQQAGIDTSTFLRGMAGDSDAAQASLAELDARRNEYTKGLEETKAAHQGDAGALNDYIKATADQNAAIADATSGLREKNNILEKGTEVYDLYTDAAEGSVAAIEAENDAIRENNDLREKQAGLAADAFTAESDYTKGVQDATAAIAENGATIDANTAQGQANRDTLVDLAKKGRDYAQTMADAGKSQEDVNGILQRARTDFLNAATAAGVGADEANQLADGLGLIPDQVTTTIKVDSAEAEEKLAAIKRTVENLPDGTIRIKTTYSDGSTATSRPVYNSGGTVRAASGIVVGEGSDIEDRVPALLSPGEGVLRRDAVDRLGGAEGVQRLNNGQGLGGDGATIDYDRLGAAVARALSGVVVQAVIERDAVAMVARSEATRVLRTAAGG